MTEKELIDQLKGNYEKAKKYRITHNQRIKFVSLYHCFENIGELETKKMERAMIEELKKKPNEIRTIFQCMLDNDSFCNDLKVLKIYSPIANNTRLGEKVIIDNEKDFSIILETIYTVRHNIIHGKKEYTQRSEKIIRAINRIFEKIVFGARLKYLS